MLGENKNLKNSVRDTTENIPVQYQAKGFGSESVMLTYTKTNKLISALYMVTDIMDKQEPIRLKLRTFGANIISDMHNNLTETDKGITAIISLLDIAFAINFISEMNCSILKKEFLELKQSVMEFNTQGDPVWLEEFMNESVDEEFYPLHTKEKENLISKGHSNPIRLGVQKGSTLMKAISDFHPSQTRLSISSSSKPQQGKSVKQGGIKSVNNNFNILKKQRREEITKIVKDKQSHSNSGGATITDIRLSAKGALISCGEKTLQRELVSMVSDGVLKKTGEKRWSKYFI